MATFISHDEQQARWLLAEAGVTILREDSADRDIVFQEVLDEPSRFDRREVVVECPRPGDEYADFGAWHRNTENEFHSVLSGRGILEYWTKQGAVSVLLEAGDIMAVRRAEHRYLPLTQQRWCVRFSGGPDSQMVPIETGRVGDPWPMVVSE